MPLPGFEALCAVVVVVTLALMARRRAVGALLVEYLALAVAGWIGEETCIAAYRFYGYAGAWHAHLADVPLAIPLIWPLVILSAMAVVRGVWPAAGRARPWLVGAVVVFDASLVEVIAVRAGLWSWAEAGHFGVPLPGILGWGWFATAAAWALERRRDVWGRLAVIVVGPLFAHAAILATWWGCFRWVLRGDFGVVRAVVGVASVGAAALVAGVMARRAGGGLYMDVALPRMVAASLFFAVLVAVAPRAWPLWAHVAAVALPYFAVTRFAASRSAAGRAEARSPSPRGTARAAPSRGA